MNCTRACAVVLKLGMKKNHRTKSFQSRPKYNRHLSTDFSINGLHLQVVDHRGWRILRTCMVRSHRALNTAEYVSYVLCTISAYSTSNNYVHSESHIYPVRGHVRGLTAHVQCRLGSGIAFSNPNSTLPCRCHQSSNFNGNCGLGSKVSFHSRTCSQREATVVGIQHV